MTNLYKTFDDNFKKEVNALIKQGLKKELPAGAVYSASKKPPEGAREFTTDRGTKYWVPGKKDKEDKPKASKLPPHLARFFDGKGNLKPEAEARMSAGEKKRLEAKAASAILAPQIDKLRAEFADMPDRLPLDTAKKIRAKVKKFDKKQLEAIANADIKWVSFTAKSELAKLEDKEAKQDKPKASSTPKTGYKSFTDAERRSLEKESMESYRNLGSKATDLYEAGTSDYGFGKEQNEATEILENKMKSGTYDRKAAEKTAMSLMDNIANNLYDGTDKVDPDTYTPKQKREAAKSWVLDFEDKFASGEYD